MGPQHKPGCPRAGLRPGDREEAEVWWERVRVCKELPKLAATFWETPHLCMQTPVILLVRGLHGAWKSAT